MNYSNYSNYSNDISYLDKIRINEGHEKLKESFEKTYKTNRMKALNLLNAQNLSFPCLFLLIPQIKEHNILNYLNQKNYYAVRFCEINKPSFNNNSAPMALKWIFSTGYKEEDLGNEYEEIIDNCVAHLVVIYNNKSILPQLTELIFKRNEKEKYIHDLVWCLYKSKDTKTMDLVGKYIESDKNCDCNLAYKLLNFKPELQPNDKHKQYQNFNKWLDENKNFLYFTDDSMQQTSNPKYWRVNLPAKYLCNKNISHSITASNFQNQSQKRLSDFNNLSYKEQKRLSKLSYKTYKNNFNKWRNWINSPLTSQLSQANNELGGE